MSSRNREPSSALRIKAFPTTLDETFITNTWEQLKRAIIEIQNKNNSGLSFEELYRNAYTLVLQKYGDRLYVNTENVVKEHITKVREDILKSLNSDFATYLFNSWKDHQTAMVMIRDILMYMDRVYVEQNKMVPIYKMGMKVFVEIVLGCDPIKNALQERALELIRLERMGECIPRSKIHDISSMLVSLGVGNTKVYQTYFEEPFLLQTKEFYEAEAAQMLAEKVSTPVFIKRVDQRIEEEKKRVHSYLDKSTEIPLVAVLEGQLITKNLAAVVDMHGSGLTYMLINDRIEEITSMYKILNMVRTGPDVMCKVICNYFYEQGKTIVTESGSNNPIKYVQDLITLKIKFDTILATSLNSNPLFKNKINKTFEEFINSNTRSPEFLSLLIDEKLRKGTKGMSDSEIENLFDMCIVIFRYLHEKDVFERYYKQHLAKRLLLGKSQSDEQERNMITKLMVECGSMFTNKFENMFRDITISKNLDEEFNKTIDNKRSIIDINVKVLTAGLWPAEKESQKVILPDEAAHAFNFYSTFYLNKHNGRKITLQANQGTAEITATFYGKNAQSNQLTGASGEISSASSSAPGGPILSTSSQPQKIPKKVKNYILQVSTYQMITLMKFNKKSSYTFTELLNETLLPERELIRCLTSLSMSKQSQRLLIKEPKTKIISPDDIFSINESFTSDHIKVKINNIVMKETEPEREKTLNAIDENRRYVIEATIVRIMKTRKTLEHNQLLTEVIEQLNQRFQPTPLLIKSRVESLLDRNYLARSETDRKVYNYIT